MIEWLTLAGIIIRFFGPFLLQWLQDLLKQSAFSMANDQIPQDLSPWDAERSLWTGAQDLLAARHAATGWLNLIGQTRDYFQWRHFNRAMNIALSRPGQFYIKAVASSEVINPLTPAEVASLK